MASSTSSSSTPPSRDLLILSRDHEQYAQLIHDSLPSESRSRLRILSFPDVASLTQALPTTPLSSIDLAFAVPTLIKPFLPQLTSLKWLQSMWAGVEPLLDPALPHTYTLTNIREIFGPLMSEYVMTYILHHERLVLEKMKAQKEKSWGNLSRHPHRMAGKRIGLLGVGSIGSHVVKTAKHFGMTVVGFTRSSQPSADLDEHFSGDQLEAFAQANLDYIVSILPNTPDTKHLLGAKFFSLLKPTALFFSVGRGSVVDELALVDALKSEKIAGAILDVFETEPLPQESPLWEAPNIYLTGHSSAISYPEDIAKVFVENYLRFDKGEELKYRFDWKKGY